MPIVLGIYIDNKIVKYAKMQKENENIKILNFNIEFYDNLSKVLSSKNLH